MVLKSSFWFVLIKFPKLCKSQHIGEKIFTPKKYRETHLLDCLHKCMLTIECKHIHWNLWKHIQGFKMQKNFYNSLIVTLFMTLTRSNWLWLSDFLKLNKHNIVLMMSVCVLSLYAPHTLLVQMFSSTHTREREEEERKEKGKSPNLVFCFNCIYLNWN